jgi:hypothetical protein
MNGHDALWHDRQRADDLDQTWDALLGGTAEPAIDTNHTEVAFMQRLHRINDALVFDGALERVRQSVVAALGPQTSPSVNATVVPAPTFESRGVGAATKGSRSGTRRPWLRHAGRLTETLLAAVLVIALGGTYVALQRPSTLQKLPLLGARVTVDRPSPAPVVTRTNGGEFVGGGDTLAFQERSGQLVLRLLTLDPGAHWELPPSVSLTITVHSGTLTIDRRPPAGRTVVTGPGQVMFGTEPAVVRNDGTTPVVTTIGLFIASSGTDGSITGSSTFSSTDVARGEIEQLPGLDAYVLNGDVTFYGDEELQAPAELTDPGRDGVALVWVSDGVIQLNHQMGHTVVTQADGTVTATLDGPGDENVLLQTGDSAFMTGGARFDLHNGGGGMARATIITIANLGRVSDSNLITGSFATPGTHASPTADVSASPSAMPLATTVDPAECTVAPRSVTDMAALLATTTAGDHAPTRDLPVGTEGQVPRGEPADEETAREINDVERQFSACYNADDLPRLLALLTDDAGRGLLADIQDLPSPTDLLATPSVPLAITERIGLFPVRDIRLLPDGRIGAIVEWADPGDLTTVDEANFHIYERSGDSWLLAAEISGFVSDDQKDV